MGLLSRHVHARWEWTHSLSTPVLRKGFLSWQEPFIIRMTAECFTTAKEYMNLPSLGLSVHHVRGSMIQRVLNELGHHDVSTPHDWKFEIWTKTIVIHKHNTCSAEIVSYAVAFLGLSFPQSIPQETKGGLSQETKCVRPKSEMKRSANKTQETAQNVSRSKRWW